MTAPDTPRTQYNKAHVMNLSATVLAKAGEIPDKIALEVVGNTSPLRLTYRDLENMVRSTATGLTAQGCLPGDRVLLSLGNAIGFPIAFLACLTVDLVPVVISEHLVEYEVNKIISELCPRLLIHSDHRQHTGLSIDLKNLSESEFLNFEDTHKSDFHIGDPNRLAYIIYTSGTSGTPRAVCHAHRTILARRMMWDGWYGLTENDRILHAGAFNWTFTLGTGLLDPWSIGATALVPAVDTDPRDLGALIENSQPTLFAAPPGIYRKLLQGHKTIRCSSLRHGLSAGEKLSNTIRESWRAATGTEIHEAFGMSECSTFISGCPDRPAPTDTLGYAQPGRKIAIVDTDGLEVAEGDSGIIAIAETDTGLMLGYWGQDRETSQKFRNGWFLTGDTGRQQTDGAIEYLGRADDMMNPGGIRVSPIEIETALSSHPEIVDCAVTEVEVKQDTRIIAAFYVAANPIDEDSLRTHMSEKLASYKRPRLYIHLEALPRNSNGKLQRKTLREQYEQRNDTT